MLKATSGYDVIMQPELAATVLPIPPAIEPVAATVVAAPLEYAPVVRGLAVRRWLAGHPVLLVALAVGVAAVLWWGGWKWRVKEDEKAFNERATINARNGWVKFKQPPTAAGDPFSRLSNAFGERTRRCHRRNMRSSSTATSAASSPVQATTCPRRRPPRWSTPF